MLLADEHEPSPLSRTEVQTAPVIPESHGSPAPLTSSPPRTSSPSIKPAAPLAGFVRPKKAPIPLPSRLKAGETKKPAATGPTTTTITEPPDSDTKVDMPVPPGKR